MSTMIIIVILLATLLMYMFASTYTYTSKFQATILYTSNGASLQKLDSSPFLVNHNVTVPYYVRQADHEKKRNN